MLCGVPSQGWPSTSGVGVQQGAWQGPERFGLGEVIEGQYLPRQVLSTWLELLQLLTVTPTFRDLSKGSSPARGDGSPREGQPVR